MLTSNVLYHLFNLALYLFAILYLLGAPMAGMALMIVLLRVEVLKKKGIKSAQDNTKMFLQLFFSLMFICSVLVLYLRDDISLGDGIPLFVSIIVYAGDKFLVGFRNQPLTNELSKADELNKWKIHLDNGTISQAEFEMQKRKVLTGKH